MFTINPTLSVKKLHSLLLPHLSLHKRNLLLSHKVPTFNTSKLQKLSTFDKLSLLKTMPSEFSESRRIPKLPHGGAVVTPTDQQEQLPCPRCESTNTKFCYYNNYNFSQPRHFCKSCRRYWTHGGTLRDIPVGGVSRKSSKRSRTCSSAATTTVVGSRNFPLQATPVLFPQSSSNGVSTTSKGNASSLYGGFTSLINYNAAVSRNGPGGGFNGPDGFGLGLGHGSYFDDVRYGQGITVWPFSSGVTDAATTASHVAQIPATWQFEGQESKVGFVSGDYLA